MKHTNARALSVKRIALNLTVMMIQFIAATTGAATLIMVLTAIVLDLNR